MSDARRFPGAVGLFGVAAFTIAALLPYEVQGSSLLTFRGFSVLWWSYLSTVVLLVIAAVAATGLWFGRFGAFASGALAGAGLLLFLRAARVLFRAWIAAPPTGSGYLILAAAGAITGAGVATALSGRGGSRERGRAGLILLGVLLLAASRFLPFAYYSEDGGRLPAIDLPLSELGKLAAAPLPPWASPFLWGIAALAAGATIGILAARRPTAPRIGAVFAIGLAELALGVSSAVLIVGTGLALGIATGLSTLGGVLLTLGATLPRRRQEHASHKS